MNRIILKKNETYMLEENFYVLKKGKILIKKIFANGKTLVENGYIKEGEIVGNFFNLFENLNKLDFYMEITALENTALEKIEIGKIKNINKLSIYERIIYQLLKESSLNLLYKFFTKEQYILIVLAMLGQNNQIDKKHITYENFNMSKSQFYLLFNRLKEKRILRETKNKIILEDNYLNYLLENEKCLKVS